ARRKSQKASTKLGEPLSSLVGLRGFDRETKSVRYAMPGQECWLFGPGGAQAIHLTERQYCLVRLGFPPKWFLPFHLAAQWQWREPGPGYFPEKPTRESVQQYRRAVEIAATALMSFDPGDEARRSASEGIPEEAIASATNYAGDYLKAWAQWVLEGLAHNLALLKEYDERLVRHKRRCVGARCKRIPPAWRTRPMLLTGAGRLMG